MVPLLLGLVLDSAQPHLGIQTFIKTKIWSLILIIEIMRISTWVWYIKTANEKHMGQFVRLVLSLYHNLSKYKMNSYE